MNVTYIHHSGFLIETEACYYLIDYFQGPIPALNPCKPVLVLASHKHHDHYQKIVFSTLKDTGVQRIYAVLSRDIPPGARPEDVPCLLVSAGKRYELPQGQDHRHTLGSGPAVGTAAGTRPARRAPCRRPPLHVRGGH